MKRKLTKRNKAKYSRLIKWAREEDISLKSLFQIFTGLKEVKQSRRIENRYGAVEDWDNAELSTAMISVPIISRKDGKILSYAAYFSEEMLPVDKKEQYSSHFSSENNKIAT
jgi:hypothetical protein